jgi:uncharacterized protein with ParB-like and HNH nuclease domain
MKAGEKTLVKYLEGNDQEFVIPVFQRHYDWRKEHCQRLWIDLLSMISNETRSHFFGSIVSVVTPSPRKTEFLIIDGQQRITTVSILMAAICNLIARGELADNKDISKKLRNEYLIDSYETETDNIRLKLIQKDSAIYSRIINNDLDDITDQSNVLFNYEYFAEQLRESKDELTVEQLFNAIRSLFIVDIQLKQGEDDPQLIFESLNSTGLALSEADKIRNLVLMNLSHKQQTDFYTKYWQRIESNTTQSKNSVSDFVRDYLTIALRRIPRGDRVYIEFKEFHLQSKRTVEEILEDMLKFSRYYQIILTASFPDVKVSNALRALLKLDNRVTFPYLMELLDNHQVGIVSNDDLATVLRTLENFLFRRTICSVPTNALNKLFTSFEKDIRKYPEWHKKYIDIFGYVISSKQASGRFPTDEEFAQALINRDIYNMQARSKIYLLEELENTNNEKVVDVATLLDSKVLTIEHIMPQTLSAIWRKSLGTNAAELHALYLHTLGNLTLTAYNNKYSNNPFLNKRDRKNGFCESKLTLNTYVQQCDNWGENEIKERAHQLAQVALKRWPRATSSYHPVKESTATYTLSEEESFRFKSILSYEFKGAEKYVSTWSDMYKQVVASLYDQDPSIMSSIVSSPNLNPGLKSFIGTSSASIRTPFHIGDGIYLEMNIDTDSKMRALKAIFDVYDEDSTNLAFTVKMETNTDDSAE